MVYAVSADVVQAAMAGIEYLSCASRNVSVAEVLRGAECYEVRAGDEPVMHYALKRVQRDNGETDGFVLVARGRCKGVDLTDSIIPFMEHQLADCDTVEICTKRRGLGKKLALHGYQLGGVILRKNLK